NAHDPLHALNHAVQASHMYSFSEFPLLRPRYTLFPYTTLFRSELGIRACMLLSIRHHRRHQPGMSGRSLGKHESERNIECRTPRSEEHTSELQSRGHLVCRLLLEKKKYLHIFNPQ